MANRIYTSKGLRNYTGEEAANLSLGQGGFIGVNGVNIVMEAGIEGIDSSVLKHFPEERCWCAIKNVRDTGTEMSFEVTGPNIETVGTFDITLPPGDVLYGCFWSVKAKEGGEYILYKG